MKIYNLHRIDNEGAWAWRTVEGDKGDYYTNSNGEGMFFRQDNGSYVVKLLSYDRFQVCKTPSGTRKKLNSIFSECKEDPCDNDEFMKLYFRPQFQTRLKIKE